MPGPVLDPQEITWIARAAVVLTLATVAVVLLLGLAPALPTLLVGLAALLVGAVDLGEVIVRRVRRNGATDEELPR